MTVNHLPFDLQTAIADPERVVTRDGRKTEFLAHDKNAAPSYRVLARIEDHDAVGLFYENGRLMAHRENEEDLFLLPKTRTLYLNVWLQSIGYISVLFDTKEEAVDGSKYTDIDYKLIAHPIEVPE